MLNYLKTKVGEWSRPKTYHPWMEFDPNKLPETELDYYPVKQFQKKKSKLSRKK
jgi:hypothetical protein